MKNENIKRVEFTLVEHLKNKMRDKAKSKNKSISTYIRDLILRDLNNNNKNEE